MEGLDVDVSRLSVAECLALAQQQDAGDKKGPLSGSTIKYETGCDDGRLRPGISTLNSIAQT